MTTEPVSPTTQDLAELDALDLSNVRAMLTDRPPATGVSPEAVLRDSLRDVDMALADKRVQRESLRHEVKALLERRIVLARAAAVFDKAEAGNA